MSHSLFAPSSAHRWINCPGSMAFPENQEQGESSTFADDGTASHDFAAVALIHGHDAIESVDRYIELNGVRYAMDEARADFIQIYLDDVRRRAIGGTLFVEYHVDLSDLLGAGQGGTCDAGIINGTNLIVEDLKYGTGEKVFASYDGEINPQLGLYLLGLLRDARLLGHAIETCTGVICQPRLGHLDEHTVTVQELEDFGRKAENSVNEALLAIPLPDPSAFLAPAERTCRWCRAKSKCPALQAFVAKEVALDFEELPEAAPLVNDLSKAYLAVPLVKQWCAAVEGDVVKAVTEGKDVIGPDGKPYKFVEGEEGRRTWNKAQLKEVEALLVGQLGPKAYAPQTIITAPAAGKLLDKKKSAQTWEVFKAFITRARGKPILVSGSDPRPAFNNVAAANEFSEDLTE